MHITLYKHGKVPIPPKGYGGAERFIYWLGKTLIELGHRVTLIANAQSHIPGAELRAVSENDPQAWQQLVVSRHRRIYAICYRFTGSQSDAEDQTQEVFL